MQKIFGTMIAALMALALAQPVVAADAKPFAEKKVVLQISDDDPAKQTLVLNVASNLVKHYGPDKVDVEIVSFGPGLKLLFANNENSASRIKGLSETSGVRFAACQNTMAKMTQKLGKAPVLVAEAQPVPAGIVRIMELVDEGYTLVRP